VEGVNHVGFGISNFEATSKFYRTLGFTELLFDIPPEQGLYGMATMMPSNPPRLRCTMLGNYYGAWIEPVQLMTRPQPRPPKKNWGHLGAMEFAIGVTNIDEAYDELQEKGIKFQSPPQTIAVNKREWKYAYLIEPDNLPVAIVEQRY
jgi:catechol 2,3-dioxygenase-like lactoylglutathione lyase family enzyme